MQRSQITRLIQMGSIGISDTSLERADQSPALQRCFDGAFASDEGTQSRNGLADDQRVHLPCALIGVNCSVIGHEASDVVLEQDAVATEQLARIADGLATFDRGS